MGTTTFEVNPDTAKSFRDTVKEIYGEYWHGNTRKEVDEALKNHIELMKKRGNNGT